MIETVAEFLHDNDPHASMAPDPHYMKTQSIRYNAAKGPVPVTNYADEIWVKKLVQLIKKCDSNIECQGPCKFYDSNVSQAVKQFQETYMKGQMLELGSLDNATITAIISMAEKNCPDDIEAVEEPESKEFKPTDDKQTDSPHYNSFFNKDNLKQFRQNHKNIRIEFGNSGIVKELHDVIMRSVGVEVDTSGNPISEVYEFIARDITESDEEKDLDNYTAQAITAASDVQYQFNFKK